VTSEPDTNAREPTIACNSTGGIAIVYTGDYVIGLFTRLNMSYFDGSVWSNVTLFPGGLFTETSQQADIYSYNNIWYLTYTFRDAATDWFVYYHESSSFGIWSGSTTIRSSGTINSYRPELSIKNNIMFLTWQEDGSDLVIKSKNRTIPGSWDAYVNNLTAPTGSTESWRIFSTTQFSNGDLFLIYEEFGFGLSYKKYTGGSVAYSGFAFQPDNNVDAPCVAINGFGSIYFVWEFGNPSEIYMRKLDTYQPQLVVNSLSESVSRSGDIDLNVSVYIHDLVLLNYSYYDQNDWIAIHTWTEGMSLSQINYTWNTNESSNRLDYLNISISVKAVDENGLDQEYIYYNINLDNHRPQRSELLNIYDDYGHTYLDGDTNFTYGGGSTGKIYFDFLGYDNNSLSDTVVTLYRGLGIFVKTNTTPTQIILDSVDLGDSNDYDFYIEVSDNFGNINTSNTINNIRIDNTMPQVNILNLSDDDEIQNGFTINISLQLSDRYYVHAYYYNRSTPGNTFQLGSLYYPSGNWSFPFSISQIEYENITIVVNITDHADLNVTTQIDLSVDNQDPTPEYLDPIPTQVGLTPKFNISFTYNYTDNDVVNCKMYYRRHDSVNPWQLGDNRTIDAQNLGGKDSQNGTHFFLYFENIDLYGIPVSTTHVEFSVNATDNFGHKGSILIKEPTIGIELIRDIPDPITDLAASSQGYNITVTWVASPDVDYYLVCRLFYDISTDYLNALGPLTRMNLLGDEAGERYCIANTTKTNFSEIIWGPNTFYYLIIVINTDGNPSDTVSVAISIEGEDPNTPVQGTVLDFWLYSYIAFVVVFLTIILDGNRRIKKKHYKARVEKQVDIVEDEVYETFEVEDIVLEDKAPMAREQSAILATEPVTGKYASFEDKDEPREVNKCPTCGWILSSSASKCPRCGWQRV
jgi:hypothetical protein